MTTKNNITKKRSINVFGIIIGTVLILYSLLFIVMILWGFLSSFKNDFAFENSIFSLPTINKKFFNNYIKAVDQIFYPVAGESRNAGLLELTYNSIIFSVGSALISTFIPFMTGYITGKFQYKFSKFLNAAILLIMIIPITGATPAMLSMLRNFGIYNTMFSMFLMQGNFVSMYYLIFHATFKDMPNDYIEAAQIDGASQATIMFRVMMPMAKTTFFAVFLLKFIFYWNNYDLPLLFLTKKPTISLAMIRFAKPAGNGQGTAGIPGQMAGAMIFCLPIFVVFICFRNRIMGDVSMGGIKG